MKSGPLTARFFSEELDTSLADDILELVRERTSGQSYLELNVFNLRIDIDAALVTVEDELDPESEEMVELPDFIAMIQSFLG